MAGNARIATLKLRKSYSPNSTSSSSAPATKAPTTTPAIRPTLCPFFVGRTPPSSAGLIGSPLAGLVLLCSN